MQRNDLPFIIVNSPIMNCSFLREFRIFRIFHSVIIFCSPSCLFFFGWAEIKSKDFEILQNMKTIRFRPFFLFCRKERLFQPEWFTALGLNNGIFLSVFVAVRTISTLLLLLLLEQVNVSMRNAAEMKITWANVSFIIQNYRVFSNSAQRYIVHFAFLLPWLNNFWGSSFLCIPVRYVESRRRAGFWSQQKAHFLW